MSVGWSGVWTLTSEMDVATVHLMTRNGTDPHTILDQARSTLQDHRIAHATLQVEPDTHQGCAEVSWWTTRQPSRAAAPVIMTCAS